MCVKGSMKTFPSYLYIAIFLFFFFFFLIKDIFLQKQYAVYTK